MRAIHVVRKWPVDRTTRAAIETVEGEGWDRSVIWVEGIGGLAKTSWTMLWMIRRRYVERLKSFEADIPVIYHDGWGLELFATEDVPRRRYVWLHRPKPYLARFVERSARYADAFIFDREEWLALARKTYVWLPGSRTFTFCGVEGLGGRQVKERMRPKEGKRVIGFVDPLSEEGARVDRLIQLIERSVDWGFPVEWRIYGKGPYEKQLKGLKEVEVTIERRDLVESLGDCDYIIYCSNEIGRPYEVMLAGLEGVVPILPYGESFGLDSGWSIGSVLGYESGDLDGLERRLVQLEEDRSERCTRIQTDIQGMIANGRHERWLELEAKLDELTIRRQMKSSPRGCWTYRTYLGIQRLLQGESVAHY